MKQIVLNVSSINGTMKFANKSDEVQLNELENRATVLTFQFDRNVPETDLLILHFKNSQGKAADYYLTRMTAIKYYTELPREILTRGRLYFTLLQYNADKTALGKYSLEQGYIYVNASLDVSEDTMEQHPDIFAELLYRIETLEKEMEILKNKG